MIGCALPSGAPQFTQAAPARPTNVQVTATEAGHRPPASPAPVTIPPTTPSPAAKSPAAPPPTATRVIFPSLTGIPSRTATQTRTITATLRPLLNLQNPPLEGADVVSLQLRLIHLGYRMVGLADGRFTEQTDAAVRHFQFLNNLPITGRVDEATRQALFARNAFPYVVPAPFPARELAYNPEQAVDDDHLLLNMLASLGYVTPGTDEWTNNRFGKTTREAVIRFQQNNKLPATGVVNYATWRQLFSPLVVNAKGESRKTPAADQVWKSTIYPVEGVPKALAYDGKRLWVLAADNIFRLEGVIQPIDPAESPFSALPPVFAGEMSLPGKPAANSPVANLAVARGLLWLQYPRSGDKEGKSLLTSVHPESGLVIQRAGLGGEVEANQFPSSAIGFDGTLLWVSAGDKLWGFNPAASRVETTLKIGWLAHGKVVSDGKCLWLAGESGLVVVSPKGVACPGRESAHSLPGNDLVFDGKRIWASDGTASLFSVDVNTGKLGATLSLEGGASGLAFDGRRVWVANSSANTVQAFNPDSLQVGSPIKVGSRPTLLLYDGKRLWVANEASSTVQYLLIDGYSIP